MSGPKGQKINVKTRGFTLIESVVAVGIFAMAMTSIMGVFLAILKLDRKNRASRVVQETARFLSEFLTREFRNGQMNYAAYSDSTVPRPTTILNLINAAGETEKICLSQGASDANCPGTGGLLRLIKIVGGTTYSSDLSGSEVTISNLQFNVWPTSNPYCRGGAPSGEGTCQPLLTYSFTLTDSFNRPGEKATMTIETSVSSRQYPP